MTESGQRHNPYLSLIGAIGAFFIAVGVMAAIANSFSGGDLAISPALWIGLGFGTLWLAISALVYPLGSIRPRSHSQTAPPRRNFGIKRPARPTGEAPSDTDPIQ